MGFNNAHAIEVDQDDRGILVSLYGEEKVDLLASYLSGERRDLTLINHSGSLCFETGSGEQINLEVPLTAITDYSWSWARALNCPVIVPDAVDDGDVKSDRADVRCSIDFVVEATPSGGASDPAVWEVDSSPTIREVFPVELQRLRDGEFCVLNGATLAINVQSFTPNAIAVLMKQLLDIPVVLLSTSSKPEVSHLFSAASLYGDFLYVDFTDRVSVLESSLRNDISGFIAGCRSL